MDEQGQAVVLACLDSVLLGLVGTFYQVAAIFPPSDIPELIQMGDDLQTMSSRLHEWSQQLREVR